MYKVYDSLGKFMRSFPNKRDAMEYVSICGRLGEWEIVEPKYKGL